MVIIRLVHEGDVFFMRLIKKNRLFLRMLVILLIICGVVGYGVGVGKQYMNRNNAKKHINHKENAVSVEGKYLGQLGLTVVSGEQEDYVTVSTLGYFTQNPASIKEQISSEYAILVRVSDGKILLDKYATEKLFPASMTKLMTALVAMERLEDLKTKITLSKEIFTGIKSENASVAGFVAGETVPAMDLLYGAILPSGAECCLGIAEYLAGSEEQFVRWMNDKAKELGMEHTNFTNVTGLHQENHYSTAYDMALLLNECLKNRTIKKIISTERYVVDATNKHPRGLTLYSTLLSKLEKMDEKSDILGGKTGFTSDAGLCLASYAKVNGVEYLLVSAAAEGNNRTEQFNIMDAIAIYGKLLSKTND